MLIVGRYPDKSSSSAHVTSSTLSILSSSSCSIAQFLNLDFSLKCPKQSSIILQNVTFPKQSLLVLSKTFYQTEYKLSKHCMLANSLTTVFFTKCHFPQNYHFAFSLFFGWRRGRSKTSNQIAF